MQKERQHADYVFAGERRDAVEPAYAYDRFVFKIEHVDQQLAHLCFVDPATRHIIPVPAGFALYSGQQRWPRRDNWWLLNFTRDFQLRFEGREIWRLTQRHALTVTAVDEVVSLL